MSRESIDSVHTTWNILRTWQNVDFIINKELFVVLTALLPVNLLSYIKNHQIFHLTIKGFFSGLSKNQ